MVLCVYFTYISWLNWMLNSPALLNQNNQVQQILPVSVKYNYIKYQGKWKHMQCVYNNNNNNISGWGEELKELIAELTHTLGKMDISHCY